MLVKLFGIVIFVRLVQPENAYSPMLVTPSGITNSVTNSPFKYKLCAKDSGLEELVLNLIKNHVVRSVI